MLLMRKEFFEDIRAGTKTTTLRYWRWCHVRAGGVQTVPGLGKVRIEAARPIEPRELTDEDARTDGFDNVAALRRALDRLYPPTQRAGRRLYQIRFTFLSNPSAAP